MPYGLQILKSDGTVWISPDFTPLNLIAKATINAVSGATYQSPLPVGNEVLFFVKQSTEGVVKFNEINLNGFKSLQINASGISGSVTIYCFADMAVRKSDYGIFLFNAQGKLVYSSDMKPLEIKKVAISVSGEPRINIGKPVAVMPAWSGRTSAPNSELGGFNIFDYFTGAFGNYITNLRIQVAGGGSGSAGFSYQTEAYYIETSIYD